MIILLSILLIGLFFVLGWFAQMLVVNLEIIGRRLKIRTFALGLFLGVVTSFPELFIGISASLRGASQLAFGNLMGGVIVLLGLVTGMSAIANRSIRTTKLLEGEWFIAIGSFIILPLLLALDGAIDINDGLILAIIYLLITNGILNSIGHDRDSAVIDEPGKGPGTKKVVLLSLVGTVGVIVLSRLIIDTTFKLADILSLPYFFTGLVFFSVGTNLPEIVITFMAWKKRVSNLGLGNLLGSAFTNPLILGALAYLRPVTVRLEFSYWILALVLVLLIVTFIYFGRTGQKFSRREGVILVGIYLIFLLTELGCLVFGGKTLCIL